MARDERDAFGRELEAALRARNAVGSDYDEEFIDSFVERMQTELDRRVAREASRRAASAKRRRYPISLAYVSVAVGVPMTGLAGWTADVEGIIASWTGLVAINALVAARGLRRHPD